MGFHWMKKSSQIIQFSKNILNLGAETKLMKMSQQNI